MARTSMLVDWGFSGFTPRFEFSDGDLSEPLAVLFGTPGDDVIDGTTDPDVIYGEGGDDLIRGLEGGDALSGGDGDDILKGGPRPLPFLL